MKISIEKIANRGVGIGYNEFNKVVFVPYTAIGDEVEVEVVKSSKNFDVAKKNNILSPSPERIESECPFFEECGGCDFQHIEYSTELTYKKDIVSNILKSDILVVESGKSLYYRNKVVFHADYKSGKLKLGFMAAKSNRVVGIDRCLLVDSNILLVKSQIEDLNIPLLDDVVFRIDNNTILVDFFGNKKYFEKFRKKILSIKNSKKIIFYYNSILFSKKQMYLNFVINNIDYIVGPNDFFQINIDVAEKLFRDIIDFFKEKSKLDLIVDGYCGSMTIGLQLAKYSKKIIGIETNKSNVKLGKKNIEKNNINNCEIIKGDFLKEIKNISLDLNNALIIDPPRDGIGKKMMQYINNLDFKYIIYVSCDPMTFRRDILELDKYENKFLKAYDMFARTFHLEVLGIFEHK